LPAPRYVTAHLFALARYAVGGFVFLEGFLAAKLLPVTEFGQYSFTFQMAALFAISGMTGGAGFGYYFYNAKGEVRYGAFVGVLFLQVVLSLAGLAAFFLITNADQYFVSLLVCFIAVPYMIFEPILRVHSLFFVALSYRFFISVGPVLILAYSFLFAPQGVLTGSHLVQITILCQLLGTSLFLWLALFFLRRAGVRFHLSSAFRLKESIPFYIRHIFRRGAIFAGATAAMTLVTYSDRIFIERFYPKENLGVYALATHLCAAIYLYFMTRNYMISTEIGDIYKKGSGEHHFHSYLNRQFKELTLAAVISLAGITLISYLVSRFYSNYSGLVPVVAMMAVGGLSALMGMTGIPLLHMKARLRTITISYVILLALVCGFNFLWVHLQVWYGVMVGSTALLLFLHAIYAYLLVISEAGREESASAPGILSPA